MSDIHICFDDIFDNWSSNCSYTDADGDVIDECSVGRVCNWGGHYIAIIHNDVPEDERKEVADFIALSPKVISQLKAENERLREALENILKHQKMIIGDMSKLSVTAQIAQKALAKETTDEQ